MPVIVRIALVLTGAALLLSGCGSSSEAPETAAVTVVAEPAYIQPTWQLVGPGGIRESGRGNASLQNLVEGGYTLNWEPVRGFALPQDNGAYLYLPADGAITFTGRYTALAGTLMIDPTPNDLNAPWSVSGPDGFFLESAGDTTLLDLPVGEYFLTWGTVAGWAVPTLDPVSRIMLSESAVRFAGEYRQRMITIDTEPNDLNVPWEVVGLNYSRAGNGDATLTGLEAGEYTLTWGAVTGWISPTPSFLEATLGVIDDDRFDIAVTFSAAYRTRTVTIDANPDLIGAPWQITGPEGFNRSGSGDVVFDTMLPGSYEVTWGNVDLWTRPVPSTVTLELPENDVLVFPALYAPSFLVISAGNFQMGSPVEEPGRADQETLHPVTLTRGFHLQVAEVTNAQFIELVQWAYDQGHVTATGTRIRDNLDGSTVVLKEIGLGREIFFDDGVFACINPGHPVKHLTWYGAAAYCDWLSLREGLPRAYDHVTWACNGGSPYTATGYRLPTEAEWEYACRAGTTTAFATGPLLDLGCDDPNLDLIACYCGNSGGWSNPVGFRAPNGWNVYGMHGNVMEWCNDFHASYDGGAATDPIGPAGGDSRVVRGGNWNYHAQYCRSANRDHYAPTDANRLIGFRPVRSAS